MEQPKPTPMDLQAVLMTIQILTQVRQGIKGNDTLTKKIDQHLLTLLTNLNFGTQNG